jgi:hypothetical protein
MIIDTRDPRAVAAVTAIHQGDHAGLRRLLTGHPALARAALGTAGPVGQTRSLLHVATDWPGHYPGVGATIAVLTAAGADVDARFTGPHTETPLHWAASSDDVEALDALLDAGADLEAPGAVIAGGTPLDDAVAFAQWRAAHRLVERGAHTRLSNAAALGLLDRVRDHLATDPPADLIDNALWSACHGGRQATAELLLAHGAALNRPAPWEPLTPLDAARRNGFHDLATWLTARGARSAPDPDTR